jgi:hypothetical protein
MNYYEYVAVIAPILQIVKMPGRSMHMILLMGKSVSCKLMTT